MNRDLLLIGISLFAWGVGEGMFYNFQPIYLQQWGADPVLIGTVLGAVGISMGVAQIPAGYLADRLGPRPILWAAWITGFIATFLMGVAPTLPIFISGMLLYGLTAFVMAPLNTYVSCVNGKLSLGRALTIISFAFNIGATLGPGLGGWIAEKNGLSIVYQVSAAFFLVSLVLIFFISPQKVIHEKHPTASQVSLHRNLAFISLFVLIFFVMFAGWLPQPLSPNFLRNFRGLTLQDIGLISSFGNLGNALISLFLGGVSPRLGLALGVGSMMLFSSIIWQGSGISMFAIGYFFVGGYRLNRAMAVAYTRPLITASQTGLAFGLIESANAIGVILAPVLAGILYTWNPESIYPISLTVLLIALGLIWIIRPQKISLEYRTTRDLETK